MSVLEIERDGGVMVLRINRPERMGALNTELRIALADAWCEFRDSKLSLPPASRVNTTLIKRAMRGKVAPELDAYAARLKEHGAKEDLMESRKAFAEKRPPKFKGWNNPEDRYRTPRLGGK